MRTIKILLFLTSISLFAPTPKPYHVTLCTLQVPQLDNPPSKLLFIQENLGETCPPGYITSTKTLCDPTQIPPGPCQLYEASHIARKHKEVLQEKSKHYDPDYSENGTLSAERPVQVVALEKSSYNDLELRERERNQFRVDTVKDLAHTPPPQVEESLTTVYQEANISDQESLQNINENQVIQQRIASGTANEIVEAKPSSKEVLPTPTQTRANSIPLDEKYKNRENEIQKKLDELQATITTLKSTQTDKEKFPQMEISEPIPDRNNKTCLCRSNIQGLGNIHIKYGEKCPLNYKRPECFKHRATPLTKGFTGVAQLCQCTNKTGQIPFYVLGNNCPSPTRNSGCTTVQFEDGLVVLYTPQ